MKFYLKKDAILKLKKSNNDDLKLIQEDICNEGNKRFYVIENKELYNKIKENDAPSFYESWIENTNLVFALDVDLNDDISDNDFDKILVENM